MTCAAITFRADLAAGANHAEGSRLLAALIFTNLTAASARQDPAAPGRAELLPRRLRGPQLGRGLPHVVSVGIGHDADDPAVLAQRLEDGGAVAHVPCLHGEGLAGHDR